jgi:hypothetical protein
MKSIIRYAAIAAIWLILAAGAGAPSGRPPAAAGRLDSLGIEDLPVLRRGIQTHQFCTYDRAGDNYDWNYFVLYTEPNGEVVIFDATGPGCLFRQQMNVWRSMDYYRADFKDVRIRYYFDDEKKPRVDMDISTFFSGKNPLGIFREPLAMDGGDDFRTLYGPMPFKKRLKIALNREPGGPGSDRMPWAGPADKVPSPRPHWCHFTYHTYTEDPGIPSWTPGSVSSDLASLWDPGKMGRDPKPSEGGEAIAKTVSLPAGGTVCLAEIEGPGSIAGLKIGLEPLDEEALFNTWLIMRWDGNPTAQVEAPLGAFFGGHRKVLGDSYSALLFGYSPAEMYCYFPMPFWKSARIEVVNRGRREVASLHAEIRPKPAAVRAYDERTCGYFFARYHREFPRTEGHDYTYLDWKGRGHIVGHTTARYDTSMEEDERTYFDGGLSPQIHGNGFEDDHNMGWGLKNRQHAVFGAIAADGGAGSVYRIFWPDLYYFQSAVKHGHQTYGPRSPIGHEGFYKVGDEESVAFFYGREEPCLVPTDELDVGRREAEAAHTYRIGGRRTDLTGAYWYDGEFNNVLFKTPAVADDGVSFTGRSEFTVAVDPANRGVRLRRRLDKAVNRQKANVYVDGRLVKERPWYTVDHDKTYRGIRWVDSDFEIPAKYTAGKSRIRLTIESAGGLERPWNEFRYWVFSYTD